MQKTAKILVIGLVMATFSLSAFAAGPARIWCLGDSITEGNDRDGTAYSSYRRQLYHMLQAKGAIVDFVGTENGYGPLGSAKTFPDPTWLDQDHDGWGGHASGELLDGSNVSPTIDEMAPQVNPDIVLLHIGTNDGNYANASDTTANIESIITKVRAVNPNVEFYVAQIIPYTRYADWGLKMDAINVAIGQDVPLMSTLDSPVTVVDMNTGFNTAWLMDGAHPDATGEAFIAQRWSDAIGTPIPEPATIGLLGTGIALLIRRRRRNR